MHRKSVAAIFLCLFGLIAAVKPASAQSPLQTTDTLKLTVKQAEDQFLKNNLQIIAQRYNIDNATAAIITAKLFPNPDFNYSNGIYATDISQGPAYKENSFNFSQLFTTAGKRNKNIQLAKIGVEQARYQFFDFLRTLKFTLRNDFYSIYFQEQSSLVYNQEINSLSKLLTAFREQYAKGNIAEKEVLRIQSQLYSLQVEYNNLQVNIDTTQSEFKMLIRASPAVYIVPLVDEDMYSGKTIVASMPYMQLLDSAYVNRYDLKLAKTTVAYNSTNLSLQKAIAVPDFSLSLNFDRLGSYGNNYLGGGIEFNLPFFNRNQGAIKQARIAVDQSKVDLENVQNQVAMDVSTNYKGALRLESLYKTFDPKFKADFNHLIQEVFLNYAKRNISLLEFLDFYDSYKTNVLQLNNIQLNRVTSLEQLNFVTGTPFFNQ